jgi:hypothetical protein
MLGTRAYPTLLLVLMGTMDCFTTVVGIRQFGAIELNPLLAGVVNTNIVAFIALKLASTLFICLTLIQAQKILMTTRDKTTRAFSWTQKLIKIANAGAIIFLLIVVVNNVVVIVRAL